MDIIYFYIYNGVYFSDNMFLIFRRCVSITYVFYWDIIGSMANNYTLMSGFAQKLVYYKTNHNGDVVGIHWIFFIRVSWVCNGTQPPNLLPIQDEKSHCDFHWTEWDTLFWATPRGPRMVPEGSKLGNCGARWK